MKRRYITAVQQALNCAQRLNGAITTEEHRHGDHCVMTNQGPVADALEELRTSLANLRLLETKMENGTNDQANS